ncbi:MAG: 1-(5-phosphoribosyl)-5-[(5-phosphoribosylamino)methylideneamino]imidazole-4-carboxamide isomerase [Thermodesulfovibrionales bacterium]|nr:1-(5-phosphoribosyl)-5-[(5-phosphoribosylamino)methylideneamino]imidazole-4-carboxamide isomerase [Thermodesulfovibrionales bacterium]
MQIIPAIDLKEGQCVRLIQGQKDQVTVYSNDPVSTALRWQSCGASFLHIVDLDGAFSGKQKNFESIINIRKAIKMIIQVGGGIRDIERIDLLISSGIDRVILGTAAIERPGLIFEASKKYPGKIFVSIDAKNSFVAVKGWIETTNIGAIDLALKMQDYGVGGIIYTDILRDGMLTGPNIETIQQMVEALDIPVIASGGISSIEDIVKLAKIKGLWGAITGKALYSGKLDLRDAIELVKGG